MATFRDASVILSELNTNDEGGDQQDEVIGNAELGVPSTVEFQRAPADENFFDYSQDGRNDCFACKYCKKKRTTTPSSDVGMWTNDAVADAYQKKNLREIVGTPDRKV